MDNHQYISDSSPKTQAKAVAVPLPEEAKRESWLIWPLKGIVLAIAVLTAVLLNTIVHLT